MLLQTSPELSDATNTTAFPSFSDGAVSVCETPRSSIAVRRSLSDPLSTNKSAISLQNFDGAVSQAIFKYPRFSTATTLTETGGPGFSIEELNSTEVSEDEDAIINSPIVRRRTSSKLTIQTSCVQAVPQTSIPQPDRLHKATVYIRGLLTRFLQAIINYMQAACDQETEAGQISGERPPSRAGPSI